MPSSPIAPKRPHLITQHGETRVDNYFWMRQREDPEVLKYLTAQMDYLEEVMGHTKPLQEALFSEMKGRIQETDSTVPEKRAGCWYYIRTEAGRQYPIFCRRKESLENPEEILLDQNRLAEGHSFCSVSGFAVSPDGEKLAYAVDYEGHEVYTVFIKDLTTGSLYPETVPNTFGSVYAQTGLAWANDNATIFYLTVDDARRSYRLFRHRLGTEVAQDILIFEETDDHFNLYFHKSRDDKFIITNHHSTLTSEVRFLSADQPESELTVLSPRVHGVEYSAVHHAGMLFIATNEGAKNFKLMRASLVIRNLDEYVERLQAGTAPAHAELLAAHPELASQLEACLAGLEFIHGASRPNPDQPAVLGDFRVLREIGRGGMGVVYEAEGTRVPRRVALKELSPQFASSTHLRLRFQREAELASKLDHPHVCTVYEAGEDDGAPYLAMRYVEGRPLSDLVASTRESLRTTGVVHVPTREEADAAGSVDAPVDEQIVREPLLARG